MAASSSSEMLPKLWQVFINLRGEELRGNFISRLVDALDVAEIKYCIDTNELPSEDLTRMERSKIALVIFSSMYAESELCLNKLVMIMEQVKEGKLRIIPAFFNVTPEEFRVKAGEFELKQYGKGKRKVQNNIPYWKKDWLSVPSVNFANFRDEREFINEIVDSVKQELDTSPPDLFPVSSNADISSGHMVHLTAAPLGYGMKQLIEIKQESGSENLGTFSFQNQENGEEPRSLNIPLYTTPVYSNNHGIIPPPPLPLPLQYQVPVYSTINHRIIPPPPPLPDYQVFINFRGDELRKNFVAHLDTAMKLANINVFIDEDQTRGTTLKNLFEMIKVSRVAVAIFSERYTESHWCLDELVVMKEQMDKGELVVIPVFYKLSATACKNLEGAFGDKFRRLKKKYRCDSNKDQIKKWKEALAAVFDNSGLKMLPDSYENIFIESIVKHVKRVLITTFVEERKNSKNPATVGNNETFTDQTLIGQREEPDTTLRFGVQQRLNQLEEKLQCAPEQTRVGKFLTNISGGREEMQDLFCTFPKELASQALGKKTRFQFRLWNHEDIIYVVTNNLGMRDVRGVLLDMSEVPENLSYDANIFSRMCNLLYLRIYSSAFIQEGKDDFKIVIPKEFQLPLDEVRYLHWVKFPFQKLPSDFNPKKLVNLELPYSSINKVWEGLKDTPKLKWVDLSYSRQLSNLSGLSNAQNLERLNLEGCRRLVNLPQEMENMKSLIFLNMRGCKRLKSIPVMKLSSLKILILSGCSRLEEFEIISENLEGLYLDGTALKKLPPAIGDLERLSILNLKDCKMLKSLPESLGKQKGLEELILSGCLNLESVPKDIRNMRYLRILLLDGTSIKEMPKTYSLQRLCLSRNNAMTRLQGNISQLYHLKWLDLQNCENLRYLPPLPPNLEFFNAHGCKRLEAVANPLAILTMTEQIRSTLSFANCKNLKQNARDVISSYAQWKCQELAIECYNRGIVSGALFNVCYSGFEVPKWFHHQAIGSVLEARLKPRCYYNNRLSGIALCAVVSFHDNQDPADTFSIKCKVKFGNEDGSLISLDYDVGGLIEPEKLESDHVFIGYGSCSQLAKRLECRYPANSIPTKALLEFYVTGARKSEVVKCGLSLVYAEPKDVSVDPSPCRRFSKNNGGSIEDFFSYICLAFACVIVFAFPYYLKFYNFCMPLLVLFLAIGLFNEWKDKQRKQ